MIDAIANLLLTFTHETVIIPLVVLGYIWLDKKIFYHATCLILISMIWNNALKITFQIPLSPTLNKPGFAFPSGHMQLSTVFYGWILSKVPNAVLRIGVAVLLVGVALSLVHFDYHTYFDIGGALLASIVLLALYSFALDNFAKKLSLLVVATTTTLLIYISMVGGIPAYVWMAYYGVLGLILGRKLFANYKCSNDIKAKILATVICVIGIALIKGMFIVIGMFNMPIQLAQLQWAIIGLCLIASPCIAGAYRRYF